MLRAVVGHLFQHHFWITPLLLRIFLAHLVLPWSVWWDINWSINSLFVKVNSSFTWYPLSPPSPKSFFFSVWHNCWTSSPPGLLYTTVGGRSSSKSVVRSFPNTQPAPTLSIPESPRAPFPSPESGGSSRFEPPTTGEENPRELLRNGRLGQQGGFGEVLRISKKISFRSFTMLVHHWELYSNGIYLLVLFSWLSKQESCVIPDLIDFISVIKDVPKSWQKFLFLPFVSVFNIYWFPEHHKFICIVTKEWQGEPVLMVETCCKIYCRAIIN